MPVRPVQKTHRSNMSQALRTRPKSQGRLWLSTSPQPIRRSRLVEPNQDWRAWKLWGWTWRWIVLDMKSFPMGSYGNIRKTRMCFGRAIFPCETMEGSTCKNLGCEPVHRFFKPLSKHLHFLRPFTWWLALPQFIAKVLTLQLEQLDCKHCPACS